MKKYHWQETARIKQLLLELEASKMVFEDLPTQTQLETNLRQHSLLKSAVFSARIEGFPDTITSPKKESQNLLSAYRFIFSPRAPKKINLDLIRKFHRLAMKELDVKAGQWRTESWAVFDQSGNALYLAPPHNEIPDLMAGYVKYIHSLVDHPAVVSAVAQFIFEKIHPFADGNGRVGRLISAFLLMRKDFTFRGLTLFEEYIDQHREDYYFHLEPNNDVTGFIEFFLAALVFESRAMIRKLNSPVEQSSLGLSPRRQEILRIIKDHPECSFDFIKRRFAAVNPKTLHYDLSSMIKKGVVAKLGNTRGALYVAT